MKNLTKIRKCLVLFIILFSSLNFNFLFSQSPPVNAATFGYGSIGGDTQTIYANSIVAFNWTGASGTATSIKLYGSASSGTSNVKCALYDSSGVNIANTSEVNCNTTVTWWTFSFPFPPSISAVQYTLCFMTDNEFTMYYDYDASFGNRKLDVTYGDGFPSSITWAAYVGYKISMYVDYTEGGEGSSGGQLRIGNESLGQLPYLFYDENSKVVTLRTLQSGHRGLDFYTDSIGCGNFSTETWANGLIKYALDADFNCFRIHVHEGSQHIGSDEWLFPSYRTANDTVFGYLTDHLSDLADNNIYFIIDWYIEFHPDYWMGQEFNGTTPHKGGLLWNTTVRDDFIWCYNYTLTKIKASGDNVWNHLVYLDPINEYFMQWGFPTPSNSGYVNSRNPYKFNGTDPINYGNAASESWQTWLSNRYGGNIEALKTSWTQGSFEEEFNYTGTETNDFSSLLMAYSRGGDAGNRGYDFGAWYSETIQNFTSYCNQQWRTYFPDLYVSWGGGNSYMGANGASVTPSGLYVNLAAAYNQSNIIDGHDYCKADNEIFEYSFGDKMIYRFMELSSYAKTTGKPYIEGEFSGIDYLAGGYDSENDDFVIGYWNTTYAYAIKYGMAGLVPYWTSYYHAWVTGTIGQVNKVNTCDERRPYIGELNRMYKAAENWIESNVYDPIMITVDSQCMYGTINDIYGVFRLFDQAGYTPKYLRVVYDNSTIIPDAIPEDVEIIVAMTSAGHIYYTQNEFDQLNDWMNSNSSKKLIIASGRTPVGELNRYDTFYLEDVMNNTLFPLSPLTRGTSYSTEETETDQYVNVSGTNVLLDHSWNFHGRPYVVFETDNITGYSLINYTGGVLDGTPMTIINDRIAWIGTNLAWQVAPCASQSEPYSDSTNGYLIISEVLEYWGYAPNTTPTDSFYRVSYGFSKPSSTHGVFSFTNNNATTAGTINPTFNFTKTGLDITKTYAAFFSSNNTLKELSVATLQSGINLQLANLTTTILTLRANDSPAVMYSTGYIENELYSNGNLTINVNAFAGTNSTTYVYWNNTVEPSVSCNASVYDITWNGSMKLLTLTATHESDIEWEIGGEDGGGDTYAFAHGFEGESFETDPETGDAWTSQTGSPIVQSTVAINGTWSMYTPEDNDGQYTQVTLSAMDTTFVQFYARWDELNDTQGTRPLRLEGSGSLVTSILVESDRVGLYGLSGFSYANYTFENDTAYEFEVKYVKHASNGEYTLYVNNVSILSLTELDTSSKPSVDNIKLGLTDYGDLSTRVYIDNVKVDDEFINVPEGETSADNVTLDEPTDEYVESTNPKVTFSFTPDFSATIPINATFWSNVTGTWAETQYIGDVTNGTQTSFNYTFAEFGTYIWNVGVYTNISTTVFAEANYTLTANIIQTSNADTTRYVIEGSFNITADGDVIESVNGIETHWKKITVEQLTFSDMPLVKIYVKPNDNATSSPTNMWRAASEWLGSQPTAYAVYDEQSVLICFKEVYSETETYFMTGEYKIVIIK